MSLQKLFAEMLLQNISANLHIISLLSLPFRKFNVTVLAIKEKGRTFSEIMTASFYLFHNFAK
jgi:hypothetical protein